MYRGDAPPPHNPSLPPASRTARMRKDVAQPGRDWRAVLLAVVPARKMGRVVGTSTLGACRNGGRRQGEGSRGHGVIKQHHDGKKNPQVPLPTVLRERKGAVEMRRNLMQRTSVMLSLPSEPTFRPKKQTS